MPLDVPFLSFEEAEGYYTCAASSAKDTLKEQKKTRTTFLHLESTKHQNNAFATCWMLSSGSLWSWKKEAFSTSSGWVWHIVKLIKQWKAGGQSSIAPLELLLIFQVGREMKIVSWVQNVSSSKQFGTGKGRGRAGGVQPVSLSDSPFPTTWRQTFKKYNSPLKLHQLHVLYNY